MVDIGIRTGNTAVRRNKPSRPLKKLLDELHDLRRINDDSLVSKMDISWFDLGCGRGDDMEYLEGYLRAGSGDISKATIDGYDPNHKPVPTRPWDMTSGSYDIVTCFYVLNVLPTPEERMLVLKDARHLVKWKGLTSVATRSKDNVLRAVADGWVRQDDGWITSTGTFQRGFTVGELSQMMFDAGWDMVVAIADNRDWCQVVGLEEWFHDGSDV